MNRLKSILVFLIVVILFLFVANFVFYEALVLVLSLSRPSYIVMSILALGSVSFIASMLLGMRFYTVFTRIYSTLTMIYMGFFGYFFLASALYIPIFAFVGDSSRYFAILIFGAVILAGMYGIFHKRTFVVKEVAIVLKGISDSWRKRKVVFISDLHIGQINGKSFVERLVQKLKYISPDILFIGGDLFDGSAAEGILKNISPLKDLHIPQGIYFVMGNHESYGDQKLFEEAIKEAGIEVLDNQKKIIDGLQIVGVDYATTAEEKDFENVLLHLHIDKNIPSLLLKHEPSHIQIAEDAGISLQISGHTHKAQQWPFEYFARMAYGRFAYGLQRSGETQVYTSSGVGTWGPPLRVGTDSEIVVFTFK